MRDKPLSRDGTDVLAFYEASLSQPALARINHDVDRDVASRGCYGKNNHELSGTPVEGIHRHDKAWASSPLLSASDRFQVNEPDVAS
jgi:hypothetical protein